MSSAPIQAHDGVVVEPLRAAERDPAPPRPSRTIGVDAVPAAHKPQAVPLVRVLMPVLMVAAIVAMAAMVFMSGRSSSPMMLALPLMLGVSMFMMFAPPQTEGDVDETRRTYLRHLALVRERALADAHGQRLHELHRHPAPGDLLSRLGTRRMWERLPGDEDLGEVRIGVGEADLASTLDVKDSGAAEDLEPVCAVSLRHTIRAVGTVPGVPVAVQLRAFRFLSFSGPGAHDLARAVIAQLVTSHGPELIHVDAIGEGWQWLGWLPHNVQGRSARYHVLVVSNMITTGMEDFIDDDAYAVIINVADTPAATALAERARAEGLSFTVDDTLSVDTETGVETLGTADRFTDSEARIFARVLTRYTRPSGDAGSFGGGLLDLVGVSDIDELTPQAMWPERVKARFRLNVPIGLDESGNPVRLDLKESAHMGMGPHGLCIGATGSGKSELLRTLVTALALTHSPDELNLVLVDFKGGATFLGCEKLPHTSAVITNLEDEAPLVERMYDAISGELNRRQEQLRAAGNFANVTDYNAARAAGHPLVALPALVIIVDEFSELLSQHPNFADLFVAVGRLGRSLGVHLLLASQRLEEGRLRGLDSHLSYRIGLKTFSAAESRQVLGVTDAYHLPASPGAGYLRAGAEELTRFQASYVSGPLPRRTTSTHVAPAPTVEVFRGMRIHQDDTEVRLDDSTTLLDAVVDAAKEAAVARGEKAHRIWLEPLPARIELPAVVDAEARGLKVQVGIVDKPYLQRQDPLTVDFGVGGGHVALCGGPQTGKTMALKTVACALAASLTTDEARLYIADFGGGELSALQRLPHVAGYVGRGDEEKLRRLVDEVSSLVSAPQPGHTFVLIDGWHTLSSSTSGLDDVAEAFTRIAADGPAARIHLVLSTPRWSSVRPSIRDLIAHRLELRLAEPLDSLIDRKAQQRLPESPGRGITAEGEQMLIAFSSSQDIEHLRSQAEAEGQHPVATMRVLTQKVAYAELALPRAPLVPFGVGGKELTTLSWDPRCDAHLVITGGIGSGKTTAVSTLVDGIVSMERDKARIVMIDVRRAHLGEIPEQMLAAYAASSTSAEQAIRDTAATLTQRLPGADVSAEELKKRSWWTGPEIFVVIDDAELLDELVLHPFIELLPHARDIGLHVVYARKSTGIGRAMFAGFLSALRAEQPAALVLSSDKDDGSLFGVSPHDSHPGRARWVSRGHDHGSCQIAIKE